MVLGHENCGASASVLTQIDGQTEGTLDFFHDINQDRRDPDTGDYPIPNEYVQSCLDPIIHPATIAVASGGTNEQILEKTVQLNVAVQVDIVKELIFTIRTIVPPKPFPYLIVGYEYSLKTGSVSEVADLP